VKHGGPEGMTRKVALQVRDECLESIKASMAEKELEMTRQLVRAKPCNAMPCHAMPRLS
jgi:hypothetical protein